MFAPVVFRFNTYNPVLSDISRKYMENVLAHPKIRLWLEQAKNETETILGEEVGT
jgi:glutathione S-transferase